MSHESQETIERLFRQSQERSLERRSTQHKPPFWKRLIVAIVLLALLTAAVVGVLYITTT